MTKCKILVIEHKGQRKCVWEKETETNRNELNEKWKCNQLWSERVLDDVVKSLVRLSKKTVQREEMRCDVCGKPLCVCLCIATEEKLHDRMDAVVTLHYWNGIYFARLLCLMISHTNRVNATSTIHYTILWRWSRWWYGMCAVNKFKAANGKRSEIGFRFIHPFHRTFVGMRTCMSMAFVVAIVISHFSRSQFVTQIAGHEIMCAESQHSRKKRAKCSVDNPKQRLNTEQQQNEYAIT